MKRTWLVAVGGLVLLGAGMGLGELARGSDSLPANGPGETTYAIPPGEYISLLFSLEAGPETGIPLILQLPKDEVRLLVQGSNTLVIPLTTGNTPFKLDQVGTVRIAKASQKVFHPSAVTPEGVIILERQP